MRSVGQYVSYICRLVGGLSNLYYNMHVYMSMYHTASLDLHWTIMDNTVCRVHVNAPSVC